MAHFRGSEEDHLLSMGNDVSANGDADYGRPRLEQMAHQELWTTGWILVLVCVVFTIFLCTVVISIARSRSRSRSPKGGPHKVVALTQKQNTWVQKNAAEAKHSDNETDSQEEEKETNYMETGRPHYSSQPETVDSKKALKSVGNEDETPRQKDRMRRKERGCVGLSPLLGEEVVHRSR